MAFPGREARNSSPSAAFYFASSGGPRHLRGPAPWPDRTDLSGRKLGLKGPFRQPRPSAWVERWARPIGDAFRNPCGPEGAIHRAANGACGERGQPTYCCRRCLSPLFVQTAMPLTRYPYPNPHSHDPWYKKRGHSRLFYSKPFLSRKDKYPHFSSTDIFESHRPLILAHIHQL